MVNKETMYNIDYLKKALKHAKKIDPSHLEMIRTKIDILKTSPYKGKKLKGKLSKFRSLRIEEYRVIYQINKNQLIIMVIDIGHRKEVYSQLSNK